MDIMDEIITVTDDDALDTMKELARTEGLLSRSLVGSRIVRAGARWLPERRTQGRG